MSIRRLHLVSVLGVVGALASCPAVAADCSALVDLALPATKILAAQLEDSGQLVVGRKVVVRSSLPAICRVQGVAAPTAESHIAFEVWMPTSGWNGRYLGVGNGAAAGSINYGSLAEAVRAGYAASSTDTGHVADSRDLTWIAGHPEWVVDFKYRAIHETAVKSKIVIDAFYGAPPRRSYFSSCSNGGRQAMVEAQDYPEDYDGVVVGAPWSGADPWWPTGIVVGDWRQKSLAAFLARGGKLIFYHGELDAPERTVSYYDQQVAALGAARAADSVRLFIVPGGHCGGGARLRAGLMASIENWVENGIVPQESPAPKLEPLPSIVDLLREAREAVAVEAP